MNTPIPDSYWVNDLILAGEYPGALDARAARRRLTRFIESGVRKFIDLTEEGELAPYEDLLEESADARGMAPSYCRHPIRDAGVPTPDQMTQVLAQVKAAVLDGDRCYVHCWGGIGRTGTVVGCWLVQEEGLSASDAINRIAALRAGTPDAASESPETAGQSRFIHAWARDHSLAARLDAVLRFHPERSAALSGFNEATVTTEGDLLVINPGGSTDDANDLVQALYQNGWCVPFRWTGWDEVHEFTASPALVADVDVDTLVRLWSTHLRADRFCDGHLSSVAETGHLAALLERMAAIRRSL